MEDNDILVETERQNKEFEIQRNEIKKYIDWETKLFEDLCKEMDSLMKKIMLKNNQRIKKLQKEILAL